MRLILGVLILSLMACGKSEPDWIPEGKGWICHDLSCYRTPGEMPSWHREVYDTDRAAFESSPRAVCMRMVNRVTDRRQVACMSSIEICERHRKNVADKDTEVSSCVLTSD